MYIMLKMERKEELCQKQRMRRTAREKIDVNEALILVWRCKYHKNIAMQINFQFLFSY